MDSLIEQTIITAAFPGALTAITARRRVDAVFDEICSDFVELTCIAAKAESSLDTDGVLESVADLKLEIKSALAENQQNSPTQKGHTK